MWSLSWELLSQFRNNTILVVQLVLLIKIIIKMVISWLSNQSHQYSLRSSFHTKNYGIMGQVTCPLYQPLICRSNLMKRMRGDIWQVVPWLVSCFFEGRLVSCFVGQYRTTTTFCNISVFPLNWIGMEIIYVTKMHWNKQKILDMIRSWFAFPECKLLIMIYTL